MSCGTVQFLFQWSTAPVAVQQHRSFHHSCWRKRAYKQRIPIQNRLEGCSLNNKTNETLFLFHFLSRESTSTCWPHQHVGLINMLASSPWRDRWVFPSAQHRERKSCRNTQPQRQSARLCLGRGITLHKSIIVWKDDRRKACFPLFFGRRGGSRGDRLNVCDCI